MSARTALLIVTGFCTALPPAASAQDTTRAAARAARIPASPVVRSPAASVRTEVAVPQGPTTQARRMDVGKFIGPTPKTVRIQRAAGHTEEAAVGAVELRGGDILGATVGDRAVWTRGRFQLGAGGNTRDSVLVLPFRLVIASAVDTQVLVVTTIPTTLVFHSSTHSFRGTVNFLLRDSLNPRREGPLPSPVNFFAAVPVGTVSPASFPMKRINLPPTAVKVAANTADDSVPLHVSTTLNPEGADVWLRVAQPWITVKPVRGTIWGYGLQKTAIHVTLPEEAGTARQVVRLAASAGEPEPSSLTLAGGETGDVFMRSEDVGTVTVWAEAGRFRSKPATIKYSSPLLFLVASLLGALIGGALAGVRTRRSYGRRVLAGILVAVAFTIGLNFTGIPIQTHVGEAVILVVAALGALFGVAGIKGAISLLRGNSGKETARPA